MIATERLSQTIYSSPIRELPVSQEQLPDRDSLVRGFATVTSLMLAEKIKPQTDQTLHVQLPILGITDLPISIQLAPHQVQMLEALDHESFQLRHQIQNTEVRKMATGQSRRDLHRFEREKETLMAKRALLGLARLVLTSSLLNQHDVPDTIAGQIEPSDFIRRLEQVAWMNTVKSDLNNGNALQPTDEPEIPEHSYPGSRPFAPRLQKHGLSVSAIGLMAAPFAGLATESWLQQDPLPDVNGDGCVNSLDLSMVLARFGQSARPQDVEDVTSDGAINMLDVGKVVGRFGQCNTPAIPEVLPGQTFRDDVNHLPAITNRSDTQVDGKADKIIIDKTQLVQWVGCPDVILGNIDLGNSERANDTFIGACVGDTFKGLKNRSRFFGSPSIEHNIGAWLRELIGKWRKNPDIATKPDMDNVLFKDFTEGEVKGIIGWATIGIRENSLNPLTVEVMP